jgi:sec-independent protein translocase protein TatA
MNYSTILLLLSYLSLTSSFVVQNRGLASQQISNVNSLQNTNHFIFPEAVEKQRKSVAAVQTMGLFGLGVPEIAIILVAGAFVLGPEKLAELGRDAGKTAKDLKEVPKEFQKGMDEGQIDARSKKAKEMKSEDE